MKKPNIIFILVDALRPDKLGCYGFSRSKTPRIDELARRSVLFENAYACINKTDPSLVSVFSGKHPFSHGLLRHGMKVTPEELSRIKKIKFLPERLKALGYQTMAVDWLGRFHKRGYDQYSGLLSGGEKTIFNSRLNYYFRLVDFLGTKVLGRDFLGRLLYYLAKEKSFPYDSAEVVTRKARKLIEENRQAPFFLFVHYWDTHDPYVRPNNLGSAIFDSTEKRYCAEVAYVDGFIGRLLDLVKKKNLLEEMLVILTADHGEGLGEHGIFFEHKGLYEPIVKVPLIVSHPSLGSRRVKTLVQHPDLLPTIIDFLGEKADQALFDGQSLLPLMSGKAKKRRPLAFFEDISPQELHFKPNSRSQGVRVGKYKLIRTFRGEKEDLFSVPFDSSRCVLRSEELYDLKKDPGELCNLAFKKPEVVKRMLAEMVAFSQRLDQKIKKSRMIIKKAIKKFGTGKTAVAITGGKDSTVLAHLIKTIFGKVPIKAYFGDTTYHFKEVYEFRELLSKKWKIEFVIGRPGKIDKKIRGDRERCCHALKTRPLNETIKKQGWQAVMAAIRWDEQESRSREKYFSPREKPPHVRVHPLLAWTEKDIWDYIKKYKLPVNPLYEKGYRSLGCRPCTSRTEGMIGDGRERSGRSQDKEKIMERLRGLGYW
jgi:phosphoadenosine phosphosulfate reductase